MLKNGHKNNSDIRYGIEKHTNKVKKHLNGFEMEQKLLENKCKQYKHNFKKVLALNKIWNIEIYLTKIQSLMENGLKSKDFRKITNSIIKLANKITRINMIDQKVKDKATLLTFKVFKLMSTLNNEIVQNSFHTKFDRVTAAYEEIYNNFEESNAEESKISLESLLKSIKNIRAFDENSKIRKRDLLKKIQQDIALLDQLIQQQKNEEIIKENLEEKFTLLNRLSDSCTHVLDNLNIVEYSQLNLEKIDSLLNDIEIKIKNTRVQISAKHNSSTNQINSLQTSLNVADTDDSNETTILEQLPELQIATVKPCSFSSIFNWLHFQTNKATLKTISEIEKIKNKVDQISENMNELNLRKSVKDQLEEFFKYVVQYTDDANRKLADNSREVSVKIQILLYRIYLKEYANSIQQLGVRVEKFSGTEHDTEYKNLNFELVNIKQSLQMFEIGTQQNLLQQEKRQLIQTIHSNLTRLSQKSKILTNKSSVIIFEEKLGQLNDTISQFSGTYESIHYNDIERNLNKILFDIEERIGDKETHDEFIKNIEELLEILNQRALLGSNENHKLISNHQEVSLSLKENETNVTKIKQVLAEILTAINTRDTTQNHDEDEDGIEGFFIKLKVRLNLLEFELNQILTKASRKTSLEMEKEILINGILSLKMILDEKVEHERRKKIKI